MSSQALSTPRARLPASIHSVDEWYTPPTDVVTTTVGGRTAWFLAGTSAATPAPPVPPTVQLG